MNRFFWHRRVPLWVVFVALGVLAAVVMPGALLFLSHDNEYSVTPDPPHRTGRAALPPGSYLTSPLAVGVASPEFQAVGWLNGEPPQPTGPDHRLVVLDIWASW